MTMTKSDIRLKRAYDPPDDADGTRVLVDRLWPRGLTKDKAALALWLKDIAPSSELRTWFGHNPARFDVFAARYRAELAENPAVAKLAELIRNGPVTLIYAARDTTHNHALVLAGYLRDYLKAAKSRSRG
jgi:uncharacterized protein YeaO (DUF488 family)